MSAQPTQPSLYERLGGIYSIACVVVVARVFLPRFKRKRGRRA